ncbi:MAG: cyclic nucleotide-binding domain-containing protein [candidate division Zixibacteria bacterium]|nr:cyclic nucleotide-binding domain-containing protein [candidate division Zixibacteria bacterium]
MSLAALPDLLRGVPALSRLGGQTLESLTQDAHEVSFDVSEVVVRQGETGDRAFLITEDSAEVTAVGHDGLVLLSALSPGELFGELAIGGLAAFVDFLRDASTQWFGKTCARPFTDKFEE